MKNLNSKDVKFVAVYARVSTSNQEDQKTIDAQLTAVREFAKNKYTIVKNYIDEGWSGDILARPGLDQLRHDARNRKFDAILIYDPDRLSRKLFYQQIVIEELKQIGIEILFVTMPPIKDASDELMFGIRGLFAQYEKAKITERFRIGKFNRVTNGHVLVSEAPYGYTYIPNKGKRGSSDYEVGHFKVNEREAGIMRNIFSWVANEKLTLRAVVRRLHDLGIQPRKSKRGVWATSTLSTLLRHKVFIGVTHWGASYAIEPLNPRIKDNYRRIKKSSRRMNPEGQWRLITVPAIIDKELFKKAGEQLKKNFETLGRFRKNDYLLSGVIFCVCGHRRAGEGPQHGKHLYYRCTDRVHSFPLPPTCFDGGINARIADVAVWQRIKMIMSSPELMLQQVERWIENKVNKKIDSTIDIESTQNEIAKLQAQEDRLADLYSKEIITLKKFEEYVVPIREKIRQFENQILEANLEKTPKNAILLPSKNEIEVFAKEAIKHLENLSFELKQVIVRTIINKAIASRKSLQVYGFINLDELYVKLFTINRNCRFAECRQVHFV